MTTKPRISSAWTPVLKNEDASRVQLAIESIAEGLSDRDLVRLYGASLSDGTSGVAVFFDYLYAITSDSRWAASAASCLTHAVSTAAAQPFVPALYGGTTGVAWALEHLISNGQLTDFDHPDRRTPALHGCDLRVDVDRLLLEQCTTETADDGPYCYDIVSGLAGFAVYALERQAVPAGRMLLEAVVERLCRFSRPTSDALPWWTNPQGLPPPERDRYPDGHFNVGLAHGVPGIVAILSRASASGASTEESNTALDDAVRWLFAQRNPEGYESCFPSIIPGRTVRQTLEPSRLAWCYGDLGVSASLYQAAVQTNNGVWAERALEVARHAARRPFDEVNDRDACLCHGAAGNGHIFNRFYQGTGESLFLDASRRWFERALTYFRPGRGIGGFAGWWGQSDPSHSAWRYVPGLLRGSAGIGLAFAAAIGNVEPIWDRVLGMSIPPAIEVDRS